MKVALLQIGLDRASRAGNTQRLVRGVDTAAGNPFAPDLLILPGGCCSGGNGKLRRSDHAALTTVRETIAWKAREWGVLIAAGVHLSVGTRVVAGAALFDPDGDWVASSVRAGADGETLIEEPAFWSSDIGTICVTNRAGIKELDAQPEGTLIVLPLTTGESDPLAEMPKDGAFRASVRPADPSMSDGKPSCVLGPNREVIAAAEDVGEAIVYVELPITAMPEGPANRVRN